MTHVVLGKNSDIVTPPIDNDEPCKMQHIGDATLPGSPAVVSMVHELRSVALRPTLSDGLPFSSIEELDCEQKCGTGLTHFAGEHSLLSF